MFYSAKVIDVFSENEEPLKPQLELEFFTVSETQLRENCYISGIETQKWYMLDHRFKIVFEAIELGIFTL